MNEREALERAKYLNEEHRFDESLPIIYRYLKDKPSDARWLTLMTYTLLATNKMALAYQTAKRAAQEAPLYSAAWLNLGRAAADLWLDKEAIRYYRRAIQTAPDKDSKSMACVNLGSVLVDNGEFLQGEVYSQQALDLKPDSMKGRANLGFCQLAQHKWMPGWRNYGYCVGSEWRPTTQFNEEEQWDGKGKGTICVYGEQGLGDEISFASMLPDMQAWCTENDSRLIVECDKRLVNLYERSFPGIEIHGSRGAKKVTWDVTDIDYSIPAAQLGEYFRLHDDDFPGTKYLTPDPDRVLQWQALFKTKKKPVIGIAWRGGIPKTAAKYRQLTLEQLLPVLKSVDAHWVSLQYKPADKEIAEFKKDHPEVDIVEYAHCTLSNDYDDVIAMTATLDHVVCMHTTIVHVCGGLEIPCWTFVPKSGQWRYGVEGDDFPWAKSVRLIRQKKRGEWDDIIGNTAEKLHAHYAGLSKSAKADARKDKRVRKGGRAVRGNGRADNRPAAN